MIVLDQSIGPHDAERNLKNSILPGTDHADLLSLRAPKLSLVLSTGNGKKSDQESIDRDLAMLKTSYQSGNDTGQLRMLSMESTGTPYDFFIGWIK
jgi:hypothetical protein